MFGQAIWCHCQVSTHTHLKLWPRGFQWHRHDFKGRTNMPMRRINSPFTQIIKKELSFFSLAFGGSTMLKFMLSLGDIPCDVDKHIPLKIGRSKWWKIDPYRINSGTFQWCPWTSRWVPGECFAPLPALQGGRRFGPWGWIGIEKLMILKSIQGHSCDV